MASSFASAMPATAAPRAVGAPQSAAPQGAVGLLGLVGSFLAMSAVFAKAAPQVGWSPLALLLWSLAGATALQLVGLAITRMRSGRATAATAIPGGGPRLLGYLLVSGLLFVGPNALAFSAAPHVGAGFIALCYAFPLVLTYGLSLLLGMERAAPARVVGVALGVAGGALLASSGRAMDATASAWALAALGVPLFIAIGNIYRTLKWPKGARPAELSAGMMAVGFLALGAGSLGFGSPLAPVAWTAGAAGLLAVQTVLFAVQYALYFRLQKQAGPVYLSQIGSVAAAVGLALAYLAFGEVPSLAQLAAVGLVGLGIVLVSRRPARR